VEVDSRFDCDCAFGPILLRRFLRTAIGCSSSTLVEWSLISAMAG
jgi:hypothetical protein